MKFNTTTEVDNNEIEEIEKSSLVEMNVSSISEYALAENQQSNSLRDKNNKNYTRTPINSFTKNFKKLKTIDALNILESVNKETASKLLNLSVIEQNANKIPKLYNQAEDTEIVIGHDIKPGANISETAIFITNKGVWGIKRIRGMTYLDENLKRTNNYTKKTF